MSPYLLNLVLANVEKVLRKGGWGRVRIEEKKVRCLAYAEDMVLSAENEEKMVHMLRKSEGYLYKKKLEINARKTKVMRFIKRGGRMREVKWR